jgi:hypothetical protein
MAKGESIDLHGINREIQSVQKRLKDAATAADAAEKKRISGLVSKLEKIRVSTSKLCPKAWGVFPATSSAKKGPAKPKG